MNETEKEAFEKWYSGENNIICKGLHHEHREAWQAACEYVRNEFKFQTPPAVVAYMEMNDKLIKENKKLHEALEKIVDRYFDLPYEVRMKKDLKEGKESLIAREALKEVRNEIIKEARAYWRFKWPEQLWTGVMFFKGERITREEFELA